MSIFKRKGLKEKDIVGLMDKLDAAPPSPYLSSGEGALDLKRCDYCGEETPGFILEVSVHQMGGHPADGRKICYPCGLRLLDGIVKLFAGQTRKEKV